MIENKEIGDVVEQFVVPNQFSCLLSHVILQFAYFEVKILDKTIQDMLARYAYFVVFWMFKGYNIVGYESPTHDIVYVDIIRLFQYKQ